MKIKRFLQLFGVLAALLLVFLLTGCGEQTKSATSYIKAAFQGLDGDGTLSLTFDKDQLKADITEKKQLTEREQETLDSLLNGIEKDYIISSKTGLSNGDTVEITGELQKDLLKNYGILFENDKMSVTVENLVEKVSISLNDYIEPSSYGFDGAGGYSLYLNYNDLFNAARDQILKIDPDAGESAISDKIYECLDTLRISPSSFDSVSNGDVIKASISMENTEIKEYGITFDISDYETTAQDLAPMETISLADYLLIDVSGFDTFGSAYVTFDTEKLTEDLAVLLEQDNRGVYSSAYEGIDYQAEAGSLAESIRSIWRWSFTTTLSAEQNLSNGDEITVICSADNTDEETDAEDAGYGTVTDGNYGVILKGGTLAQSVEGLPETASLDLSKYLHMEFTGFDSQGTYSVTKDTDALQNDLDALIVSQMPDLDAESFHYSRTKNLLNSLTLEETDQQNLSNGDEVTLKVLPGTESLPEYGIYLTVSDVTEQVSGLVPEVTVSLEELTETIFSGYNGAGHLQAEVPSDALQSAISSLFKENSRTAYDHAGTDTNYDDEVSAILYRVESCLNYDFDLTVSDTEKLTNGDTITISLLPSQDAAEDRDLTVNDNSVRINRLGIWLAGFSKEITAGQDTPLPEPEPIDLTKAVEVTFSGTCPNVTAHVTIDDTVPYLYQTSLRDLSGDEAINAENGYIYEKTITHNDEELLEMGYAVTEDTFTYEVTGLDTWTLQLQSPEDAALADLAAESAAQAQSEEYYRANDIRNVLTESEGWIVWEDVQVVPEETWYAQGGENSYRQNILGMYGHITVPVRAFDRSVSWKEAYYISSIYNISQNSSGELASENALQSALYYSREEAEEALRGRFNDAVGEDISVSVMQAQSEPEEYTLSEAVQELPPQAEAAGQPAAQTPSADIVSKAAAGPVNFNGHTYYRFDQMDETGLTWTEAKEFCENAGGHLASITSLKEEYAIKSLMQDSTCDQYWLGGTDEDFEGDWKWVTGEEFSFTFWDGSQPDNYQQGELTENYITFYPGGRWNDLHEIYTGAGFILEMEPEETADEAGLQLLAEAIPVYSQYAETRESVLDSYGNRYFQTIALDAYNRAMQEYDLKGAYDTLAFTLAVPEDADSEASYEIAVWGDNTLLYAVYDLTRADAPDHVCLDVSGVNRLSIQTRSLKGYGWVLLNDAVLSPEGAAEVSSPALFLRDIPVISSYETDIITGSGIETDAAGRIYRDALIMDSGRNSEIIFNAGSEPSVFSASLAMAGIPSQGVSAVKVQFLADETVLGEYLVDFETGVVSVELEFDGTSLITIRTSKENEEGGSSQIVIGNLCLKYAAGEEEISDAVSDQPFESFVFAEPAEGYDTYADMITCGKYRYYRYDKPVTLKDAERFCSSAGGKLADPADEEQEKAVQLLINNGLGRYSYWTAESESDDPERTGALIMQIEADESPDLQKTTALAGLEALEINNADYRELLDNEQNYYQSSLWLSASNTAYVRYDLQGKYDSLSGKLMLPDDNQINSAVTFAVFGDSQLIFSQTLQKADDPVWFRLDLAGIDKLEIMASSNGYDNLWLVDPQLTASDQAEAETVTRLQELTLVDSGNAEQRYELFNDDTQALHGRVIRLNAGGQGYVLYNLNGAYKELQLTVVSGTETASNKGRTLRIISDQETVYETDLSGRFGQSDPIVLDLTGVQTLRIETESEDEMWDPIYIADDCLR